jgi:4-hydroxythreonine-4-phosphate dehydrogenase
VSDGERPSPIAPLLLTMGEPAGIGGEIALKAWLRRGEGLAPFAVLDDPDRLAALAAQLGLGVKLRAIAAAREATAAFTAALPVLPQKLPAPAVPGKPSAATAAAVIGAIERAARLALAGEAAANVTHPNHNKQH